MQGGTQLPLSIPRVTKNNVPLTSKAYFRKTFNLNVIFEDINEGKDAEEDEQTQF